MVEALFPIVARSGDGREERERERDRGWRRTREMKGEVRRVVRRRWWTLEGLRIEAQGADMTSEATC